MKLRGINAIYDNDDEIPSEETWTKGIGYGGLRRLQEANPQLVSDILDAFHQAYQRAVSYTPEPVEYERNENGQVIIPKGTLMHLSPIRFEGGIDYDKLLSIKQYGLISLGMLRDGDDEDNEVPFQVSFHRFAEPQTMQEKIDFIKRAAKASRVIDLGIIVDTRNEGLRELMAYDTSNTHDLVDRGHGFRNPQTDEFYAYRYKQYPEELKTEAQKQALGFLQSNSHPIDVGENFSYLPVAVPSKYITGFVLPDRELENSTLIKFLKKNFPNAILISMDGKTIDPPSNQPGE